MGFIGKCGKDLSDVWGGHNVQNKERPLHVAARHGHVKMVEALLDDDANPLLRSTVGVFYLNIDTNSSYFGN